MPSDGPDSSQLFRPSFLQRIYKALETQPGFHVSDFEIETGSDGRKSLLSIVYRRFFVNLAMDHEGSCSLELSPGATTVKETQYVLSAGLVGNAVEKWLRRVVEDLAADPMIRATEERLKGIEAVIAALGAQVDADAYFTASEIMDVRRKLDEFEAKQAQQIKESGDAQQKIQAELKSLHDEVAELKARLSSTTKGQWVRDAASHLFHWLKDPVNQLMVGVGVEYVKGLLPK